jgi:hypothetical protein
MEKLFLLLMKLSSPRIPLPLDKQAHFATGFIGGALFSLSRCPISSAAVVSIGAGLKEGYDYAHKENHTPDIWDWVATSLGGVLGVLLTTLVLFSAF